MSNKDKAEDAVESKEGIDIKKVTFNENGEVEGLDDAVLGDVVGGGESMPLDDTNVNCPCVNTPC